jgi:hypothetical protein
MARANSTSLIADKSGAALLRRSTIGLRSPPAGDRYLRWDAKSPCGLAKEMRGIGCADAVCWSSTSKDTKP